MARMASQSEGEKRPPKMSLALSGWRKITMKERVYRVLVKLMIWYLLKSPNLGTMAR